MKLDLTTQTAELAAFYDNYLLRKVRRGDQLNKQVNYKPEYYIIGLTEGAQIANKALAQTIGWTDVREGSTAGVFDPLAE